MGYALFTARKLSVSSRLNLCNAHIMSNTERAYSLTARISALQSQSSLDKTTQSKNAYTEYSKAVTSASDEYQTVLKNEKATDAEKDAAKEKYNTAQTKAQGILNEALAEIDSKSAMTDIEIQDLNMEQTQLDQQKKTLETQLTAYTNELEAVEKAEEDAIKKAAPKF